MKATDVKLILENILCEVAWLGHSEKTVLVSAFIQQRNKTNLETLKHIF